MSDCFAPWCGIDGKYANPGVCNRPGGHAYKAPTDRTDEAPSDSSPRAQREGYQARPGNTVGPASPNSRFTPDEQTMRRMVLSANERAERLAARIVAAEHAVKSGQSSTVVLALLGGAEDGSVVLPDGCVDGHSPDLVNCALGVDWP